MPFEAVLNLTAEGTIRPYRLVKMGSADNAGLEADANEQCVGISDGSARAFDDANHALNLDQIHLQPGKIKWLEGAGAVSPGGQIKSDGDGKGVAVATSGTTTQLTVGIALETFASTKVSRMQWALQQFDPDPT